MSSDSELEIERDEIPDIEEDSGDDNQSTERMIRNMRAFEEIQSSKKVKKNGNKPKQVYVKLDLKCIFDSLLKFNSSGLVFVCFEISTLLKLHCRS